MMQNRLKVVFRTLDHPVDGRVKRNDWGDIYDEVRNLLDTHLNIVEEYEDKYTQENPYLGTFPMKRKTLIYSVDGDKYNHTRAMVNLLGVLDVDCGFELYYE